MDKKTRILERKYFSQEKEDIEFASSLVRSGRISYLAFKTLVLLFYHGYLSSLTIEDIGSIFRNIETTNEELQSFGFNIPSINDLIESINRFVAHYKISSGVELSEVVNGFFDYGICQLYLRHDYYHDYYDDNNYDYNDYDYEMITDHILNIKINAIDSRMLDMERFFAIMPARSANEASRLLNLIRLSDFVGSHFEGYSFLDFNEADLIHIISNEYRTKYKNKEINSLWFENEPWNFNFNEDISQAYEAASSPKSYIYGDSERIYGEIETMSGYIIKVNQYFGHNKLYVELDMEGSVNFKAHVDEALERAKDAGIRFSIIEDFDPDPFYQIQDDLER
jgi:hypothetical protein